MAHSPAAFQVSAVFFRVCSTGSTKNHSTKEKYIQGFFLWVFRVGMEMLKKDHTNRNSRKLCLGMERRKKETENRFFPKVNHIFDVLSLAILGIPNIWR